jgi:hypothetical protein
MMAGDYFDLKAWVLAGHFTVHVNAPPHAASASRQGAA